MKIRIENLGCRLNQSEIQSISTLLLQKGHEIARTGEADVVIINSCAVTLRSEGKTRRLIARAAFDMGRQGRVIVAGCMSDTLEKDGNIYYIPNDYKFLIPELVGNWDLFEALRSRPGDRFRLGPPLKSSTNRVNLKIQDGCDNFCSYCIVPLLRGKPQSNPSGRVIEEFSRLLDEGYKEIILTGVMIGQYQSGNTGLADLIETLLRMRGNYRIHLTSLNPVYLTKRLSDLFIDDKMVKHLHLSLQSGSDRILGLMNRKYTREDYLRLTDSIRTGIPNFNLTTDVIVGFPGETEEDFRDTLDLVAGAGFSHVHTFRFSPRPGTRAAAMMDTVPERVKTDRSRELIALSSAQKQAFYGRFNGRKSVFLSERSGRGSTSGFNEYYVPIEVTGNLPQNEFYMIVTALEKGKLHLTGTIGP